MPQLKLPTMSQPGFDLVFGYAYTGLVVNLCMAAANAPLAVAVLFASHPLAACPFLLLLSLTLAPSVVAAFAAFEAANAGGTSPFAAFWRGWLRGAKPAFVIGPAVGVLVLLVGLDLSATAGTPAGALLAPVLLIVIAIVIAAAVIVLTGLATTGAGAGALVRASVYLALRRAPLSLLSLAALAGACVFVFAQPVLGTLLGTAPLLFVVFSNSRAALAPLAVTDAAGE